MDSIIVERVFKALGISETSQVSFEKFLGIKKYLI
jgi:hypothetical protein